MRRPSPARMCRRKRPQGAQSHAERRVRPDAQAVGLGLGGTPTSEPEYPKRIFRLIACLRLSRNGITFFFSKKNKTGEEFVKFTHRLNSFQISRIVRLVLSWFPAYGARGFHAFLTGSCNTASSSDRLPHLPGKHPD